MAPPIKGGGARSDREARDRRCGSDVGASEAARASLIMPPAGHNDAVSWHDVLIACVACHCAEALLRLCRMLTCDALPLVRTPHWLLTMEGVQSVPVIDDEDAPALALMFSRGCFLRYDAGASRQHANFTPNVNGQISGVATWPNARNESN